MGREDAPRLLRRKDGIIFLPRFLPAEAASAHPPGPRTTSRWVDIEKEHYGAARGLAQQVLPLRVYNIPTAEISFDIRVPFWLYSEDRSRIRSITDRLVENSYGK
jgi:hypothetical protein